MRLQLGNHFHRIGAPTAVAVADGKRSRGDVAVTVAVHEDLPAITGDHVQLTQVFANLLINAYEALGGQGTVALGARLAVGVDEGALMPDGLDAVPTVVIDVGDDGPGVPPGADGSHLRSVLHHQASRIGLGLAIVRKIVDAHEGRIDVSSNNGRGTCFRVTLPVAGAQDAWRAQ